MDWDNIDIDGEKLKQLRFTDDIVLISDNLRDTREMQQATQKVGLKINYNKSKMMTSLVSSEEVIIAVKIVEKYIYLGHEIKISRTTKQNY